MTMDVKPERSGYDVPVSRRADLGSQGCVSAPSLQAVATAATPALAYLAPVGLSQPRGA